MDTTAEISGAVWAAFHHRFEESEDDFLAILLGDVNVVNYRENSDMATQTDKSKERLLVQDWRIVSMDQVMDVKTGMLKIEPLQSGSKFVGILKFKNNSPVEPSFMDRRLMNALNESYTRSELSAHPVLYILVGKDITPSILSIRVNTLTYLLQGKSGCNQEPWSDKIPLLVPNLGTDQRVGYIRGIGGGTNALSSLTEGIEFEKECYFSYSKTFGPVYDRFGTDMAKRNQKVGQLEFTKKNLLEEIARTSREVENKLELCREMSLIKGLQGDLKTALTVISEGFGEVKCERDGTPDMFDNQSYSEEMETYDFEETLPILNQSH